MITQFYEKFQLPPTHVCVFLLFIFPCPLFSHVSHITHF